MNLGNLLNRLGPEVLPFADAASDRLPFRRLLRLGLFQVSVGLVFALLAGTLNRVMIVEMTVAATIVAAFLAIPMLSSPLRAILGHRSDHHRSAFGWRRVPYLWGGTFLTFVGLALIPFPLIVLDQVRGYGPTERLIGLLIGSVAFIAVGIGAHTVQTAGLALATDQSPPERRPRVVSFLYVNFLIGLLIGGLGYSFLLRNFTSLALVQVVKGSAILVLALNLVALWKQEPMDEERAKERSKPVPSFAEAWRTLTAHAGAKRMLWAVGLGSAGFAMQDVLLEPYGGQIMGLGVAGTSLLTAASAVGALFAFGLAARWLPQGVPTLGVAGAGALAGTFAFAMVVLAPVTGMPSLLYAGALLIGFGGGLFTVGTLTAAMRLDRIVGSGLAVGAWGAIYASAAGLAVGLGGVVRDVVARFWMQGGIPGGLSPEAAGYMLVYHLEVLALFGAVVLVGPIVRRWDSNSRSADSDSTEPLGLAEMPG